MQPTKFRILSAITTGSLTLAVVAAITVGSGSGHLAKPTALTAQTESFPPVNLDDCPTLHAGYPTGGCVAQLQKDLDSIAGKDILTVDGTFGPATRQALVSFQREYGLRVDGVSGQKTAMTFTNLIDLGVPSMPAPANYPPTFNPAVAASWAVANAATASGFFNKSDPCTEFTSRALNAGGLPPDPTWYPPTDGVDRYINSGNLSSAWDNVNAFVNYAVGNGWARMIPLDLNNPASALMARPGDLVYLIWDGGTHMTMATGFAGNELLVSEKTGDSVTYGMNVAWNLSHAHDDVPINQHYKGARAYLLHWNESVV